MIFVEASKEDFEEVVEIENTCFIDPYPRSFLEYEFEQNPLNKIIVCKDKDKVVGFIDFMITFNSATISQIAVKNEYRKQGIATELLNEMEKCFPTDIEDVVENVTLEVRESNSAAINLYKKNGYEEVVIKKHYYSNGENAIYMVKRLLLCR